MDDSSLFMQWAVDTLQHQDPAEAVADDGGSDNPFHSLQHAGAMVQEEPTAAIESWSSPIGGGPMGSDAVMDQQGGWSTSPNRGGPMGSDAAIDQQGDWSMSPNPGGPSAPRSSGTGNNLQPMGWSFNAVFAQPSSDGGTLYAAAGPSEGGVPEMATRRAARTTGPSSSQGHIMAERKRRETMNQRFIELSTVIPGLKKRDKGTILSDAARYVKELEERIKSLEAAASRYRGSIESMVLVAPDYAGSAPFSAVGTLARNPPVPEIKATLSENNLVVRIHCENGKGLVVRVLAEVEELHLRIVHSNVTPFSASTVIITAMAKVEEGFTINAEEIVERLNYVLNNHSFLSSS